jgi:DNA repair photolyase
MERYSTGKRGNPSTLKRDFMILREVTAKTVLSASKIYPYVLNPYTGCQFGCSYCYASYMKRFTGHTEPWGTFADVKINAADLLEKEIRRKKKDTVWISGVCDPYQPLERAYGLTGRCVRLLVENGWPVRIQTKSDLVLRDIDIFRTGTDCHVGMSVTTADDSVRALFEPHVPAITDRICALRELHAAGIRTYAMIAPVLPGVECLVPQLRGAVDYLYVDRMNYGHAAAVYRANGLERFKTDAYFGSMKILIQDQARQAGIRCTVFY